MEVVRFKSKPVWSTAYGGGMVKGFETMARDTFNFLKKAMRAKTVGSTSARGPATFNDGEWNYVYTQEGGIEEFSGYEEILYKGKKVFYHRIIGGTIIPL
jgi:hypothetical protein